eukprot:CAMPEP_0113915614 /NCGR_PEP_ID=MMETSP0780_2-20120614/31387_1 /TAXON_ID=652834 /ORGANISM="Palpitomonas bilix" /LENGTH=251 /DNA_ID=CAMNT_0000914317 /DNA_START=156 /DNA_END=908 /DNA_ORIENTATION=- /assembly_acc=CAM_ASM_000599
MAGREGEIWSSPPPLPPLAKKLSSTTDRSIASLLKEQAEKLGGPGLPSLVAYTPKVRAATTSYSVHRNGRSEQVPLGRSIDAYKPSTVHNWPRSARADYAGGHERRKPALLAALEAELDRTLCENGRGASPISTLDCYRETFDRVIGAFSTYADLLSRIKRGYEDALVGQPWASSSQEQPVSLGKQTDCDAEMAKLRTQCTDLETQLRKTQAMLKDKDDEENYFDRAYSSNNTWCSRCSPDQALSSKESCR